MARWLCASLVIILGLLDRVAAGCGESGAESQGYDPYDVGNLDQRSAQYGVARGQTVNLTEPIPSNLVSPRSTTIQRFVKVQGKKQCSGLAATCNCVETNNGQWYTIILSVDFPACTAGPFPIIWFFHGFGGQFLLGSNSYDIYIGEAVANGYATIQYDVLEGTIPILIPDALELDFPMQILNYLMKESIDPGSVFYHKFNFQAIGTTGHSRGGKMATIVYATPLLPNQFGLFLIDPVDCTCFGPCTSNCYPQSYALLEGKDLTYAVIGATVKGCCNPNQVSCSVGGIGCTASDYEQFMQYASPESVLYLDDAGHIQYGFVTLPIQKASNLVCFYNPARSDAEVQMTAAKLMVDWFNSQLPPMAKAFASYVPKCLKEDPHTVDLVKHLKEVSGGLTFEKKKEKLEELTGKKDKVDLNKDSKGKIFLENGSLRFLQKSLGFGFGDFAAPAPSEFESLSALAEAGQMAPAQGMNTQGFSFAEKAGKGMKKKVTPAEEAAKEKEWAKKVKEADESILTEALKDDEFKKQLLAEMKEKPKLDDIEFEKPDIKEDLEEVADKAKEIKSSLLDIFKDQKAKKHNVSGLVADLKEGAKDEIAFKKDELAMLKEKPEDPKTKIKEAKEDVKQLILSDKQDIVKEIKVKKAEILEKAEKFTPAPTPKPKEKKKLKEEIERLKQKKLDLDPKKEKEAAKEDITKLKAELDPKTIADDLEKQKQKAKDKLAVKAEKADPTGIVKETIDTKEALKDKVIPKGDIKAKLVSNGNVMQVTQEVTKLTTAAVTGDTAALEAQISAEVESVQDEISARSP